MELLEPYRGDPEALAFNNNGADPSVPLRLNAYLGLSHYRLGEREKALPMLKEAKRLYQASGDLRLLPPEVARDLDAALADLEGTGKK